MEIHTTQLFDAKALSSLLASPGTIDPEQYGIIKAFNEKRKGGLEVPITYRFARCAMGKAGLGRLYGCKGSIETMKRTVRGALCDKLYWDMDMVNCHPVILSQMMDRDDYANPVLTNYVNNRDIILNRLKTEDGLDRDDAKAAVIRCLYGGKPSSSVCDFLQHLYNEIRNYTKILMTRTQYSALLEYSRKADNTYGTFLSWILQTEERNAVLAVRDCLMSESRSVDVIAYDGVMIRKLPDEVRAPEELLAKCEDAIARVTPWKIKMAYKPMETMALKDGPALDLYSTIKAKWEKDYFYFLPTNTIVGTIDGSVVHYTLEHARNAFGGTFGALGAGFITQWMSDPDRRTVRRMSLMPDDRKDSYTLFQGFAYAEDAEDTEDAEVLEAFNDLIDHVCNRDETIKDYLLNWLSHLLLKPFENPGKCIIFSGKQGTGKDTLGNFVGKWLLGPQYFANYESADVFWSPYDQKKEGKLLMKLEEACGSDNRKYAATLKARITAETITINPKGVKAYELENFARYIMTTNEGAPVVLEENADRRFILVACGNYHAGDTAFWDRIYAKLFNAHGGAVVGSWIASRDISAFDIRKDPITSFKVAARETSKSSVEQFVEKWDGTKVTATQLFEMYKQFCIGYELSHVNSSTSFGLRLLPFIRDGEVLKTFSRTGTFYCKPTRVAPGGPGGGTPLGDPLGAT